MQQKTAEHHQNLPLHFEVARFSCTKNPAFLLNSSAGSFRTVEDELDIERRPAQASGTLEPRQKGKYYEVLSAN
jgi:hypothetical protein